MAIDRFLYFVDDKPDKEKIQSLLESHAHRTKAKLEFIEDRWYLTLQGTYNGRHPIEEGEDNSRWVEVWLGEDCMDVITRFADSFTNHYADFLAHILIEELKIESEEDHDFEDYEILGVLILN